MCAQTTTKKRVAIIGGGPCGLAAARALFHDVVDFNIVIYESQDRLGGVWVYTGEGPVYRDLDTNIFKELMEYENYPFPEALPRYPHRKDVWKYVESYGHHITASYPGTIKTELTTDSNGKDSLVSTTVTGRSLTIKWGSTVKDVTKSGSNGSFLIQIAGLESREEFDFVIVASGHFDKPLLPQSIDGLESYMESHPDKLTHTRHYDNPEKFRNQKVLVIGNGSSGTDIIIQLRSTTTQPVVVSRRSEAKSDTVFKENEDVIWKPEIKHISDAGVVTFSDGTSDTFDSIVVATGYKYAVPFLQNLAANKELRQLPSTQKYDIPLGDQKELRVPNLYKFIFYIGDPRLAFVGLNKNVVPMPLSECQGAVIARVFDGRLKLPSTHEMVAEEAKVVEEKGSEQGYLVFGYPKDIEYMHMLNDWAEKAPDGFLAEHWGPEKDKLRAEVADAKLEDYARKLKEARKKADKSE